MSYDVVIVVPPVPSDDAQAWKQLDSLIEQFGDASTVLGRFLDRITARYPCLGDLSDDNIDDGVWSNDFSCGHRAAVLSLTYSRINEVLPFLVETANSLGLVVFDLSSEQIHRGCGGQGLQLTVENEPVVRAPLNQQLHAAVDRLTAHGGPGFLIVDGSGEDYSQVAGGDGVYTAEWREYSGKIFRHWKAGRPGLSSDTEVEIATNGFKCTVRENERLGAAEVKTILTAFAERRARPEEFSWREMTDLSSP